MEFPDSQEADIYDDDFAASEFQIEPFESSQPRESETVIYYRNRISKFTKTINKLRGKIQYLRKLQVQFALLLNKTVEAHYGALVTEVPVQKPTMPPLPPIHKAGHTELMRLLHNNTPAELAKFLDKSSVVPRLLFSDTSVLDDQLIGSLMRSSPDIQVSFFVNIIKQVKSCGEFFEKLRPMLSRFANDSALISQIEDADAKYEIFYSYYQKCMNEIASIIGYKDCKIVYCTQNGRDLLYPGEEFSHMISMEDSLCGQLIKQCETRLASPTKDPSFEVVSETPVFEGVEYILTSTFKLGSKAPGGLLILSATDQPFTDKDESHMSIVTEFLTPLLLLFRSVFLRIAPSHFATLSNSISRLKGATDLTSSFEVQLREICAAQVCKLWRFEDRDDASSELPMLPPEDSLIRAALAANATVCYSRPRMRPGFNKNVDDERSLTRISSMLIAPIKGTNIVAVLYNSMNSSTFTPIQKAMADNFSLAMPPLLGQITVKQKMDAMGQEFCKVSVSVKQAMKLITPLIRSMGSGNMFDIINENLPEGIQCYLFLLTSDIEAIRFPDRAYVEVPDELVPSNNPFLYTKDFDVNIVAGGDEEVKEVLIVSSKAENSRSVCVFCSKRDDGFDEESKRFLPRFGNILLFLLPWMHTKYALEESLVKMDGLRDVIRGCVKSLSKLIDADVDCTFFNPPVSDEPDMDVPLLVSVETTRGIEAVLTSHDTSETTKSVLISYAGWLSTALDQRQNDSAQQSEIVKVLVDAKVCDVFKCSEEKLCSWVNSITSILQYKGVDRIAFVKDVMSGAPWTNWFTERSLALIILAAFLKGIEKVWKCKTDRKTVSRLDGCSLESCATLAAVFAVDFGLADALDEETISSMAKEMDGYIISDKTSSDSSILIHLRSISMHGFRLKDGDLKWLGKTLVLFASIHPFTYDTPTIGQRLLDAYGELGRKSEVFRAERVYLPIVSFLSQRHDRLVKVNAAIREAITEARRSIR